MGSQIKARHPLLTPFVREELLTREDVQKVTATLLKNKAIDFKATQVKGSNVHATGGRAHDVHVRDNVFLAYALDASDTDGGGTATAVDIMNDLAVFFLKTAARFDDIIGEHADKNDAMSRPHVRFNGGNVDENPGYWNHKQNDALGYFMWMRCQLCFDGKMRMTGDHLRLLGLMLEYFLKIEFWRDEDGGHWGELGKIQASSIGAIVAGVKELKKLVSKYVGMIIPCADGTLEEIEERGVEALAALLPKECDQPGRIRNEDSALLFLVYPLGVVDGDVAKTIVNATEERLVGKTGVRRYNGDGFWCKDFRHRFQLPHDISDAYFSEADIEARNAVPKPGEEAQWTVFDPILSVVYGKWFKTSNDLEHLKMQQYYLNRSLAQVTGPDCVTGAWKFPQCYCLQRGKWEPNDAFSSLWTQANVYRALVVMDSSLALSTETVKDEFKKFDSLGGGSITLDDLVTVLVKMNSDLPADDLVPLLRSFAGDNGNINFDRLIEGLFSGTMAQPVKSSFNLCGLRQPSAMSSDEFCEVERVVTEALLELGGAFEGEYYPLPKSQSFLAKLGGMSKQEAQVLERSGIMFRSKSGDGRGVFATSEKDIAVFVNSEYHVEILVKPEFGDHALAPKKLESFQRVLCDTLRQSGYDVLLV